jgi:hypothetical protein
MAAVARTSLVVVLCLALSGCYVKMTGNQSTSGGTTTTATSSQVSGSAKFSGGKVGFSSGQPIPPGASGGTVKLSGNAAGVLIVGVMIADFVNVIRGQPKPVQRAEGVSIAETCSCYRKDSDEIKVTR